jgi:hypothetical protein
VMYAAIERSMRRPYHKDKKDLAAVAVFISLKFAKRNTALATSNKSIQINQYFSMNQTLVSIIFIYTTQLIKTYCLIKKPHLKG